MPNFAIIEQRVNAAVNKTLANATADFGNDLVIDVIFDAEYAQKFGMSGSNPFITFDKALHPSIVEGDAVTISTINYAVESVEPDGTGMLNVELSIV